MQYRLVTRSDFDGLTCAILLREIDMLSDIVFAHPKDMQDGVVSITREDIITNLPYHPNAYLVFDHHLSEAVRVDHKPENFILDPSAPSAARIVYNYFGGKDRFPHAEFFDLMAAVDKSDSGQFSMDEVLDPNGWILLNFLMDSRTGLGRFRNFQLSNYDLMLRLIDLCRELPIDDVLASPDVKERVDLYNQHREKFVDQIKRCTVVSGNVGVIDLRDEKTIYSGNRFMIYALFPAIRVSIHVMWGKTPGRTIFAVGKSIFNRTSQTDVGPLMLKYGGGGHKAAGTCQVPSENADTVLEELVSRINADG